MFTVDQARNNLITTLGAVLAFTKTYDYFLRVLSNMVRDLYRGYITQWDFVTSMTDLVQQQLERAWNEGMRANGLDPETDMLPEWEAKRDELIISEFMYIDGYAHDIVKAAEAQLGWEPLLARAQIWAGRYTEVMNTAIVITKEQKLKWVYGDTQHCGTCEKLNGIVAFTSEWELANVFPQNPPNSALDCGGWRCQCYLEPTTERHTYRAWEKIMAAVFG